MTDWTTPASWTGTPSESFFNTHIRDNENYLYETIPTGMRGSADRAGVGGAGTSEEWDTATPGLTWSPTSPTTVDSHTTVLGHLYLSWQADATERLGTKSWAPAGAFDARTKVIVGAASAASVSCAFGLHVGNSDNTSRLFCTVQYTFNTGVLVAQAYTYATGSYTQRGSTITIPCGATYLRIVRDGSNNCSFYWSPTGTIWNLIATQSHTLTVANIGYRGVGNATAGFQAALDFLRTSV